jgi:hypothetical protein
MTLRFGKAERSVQELYRDDPERGDAVAFGRRGALKGTALAAMGAAVGGAIPFAGNMSSGTLPALFARPAAAQGAVEDAVLGPRVDRHHGVIDVEAGAAGVERDEMRRQQDHRLAAMRGEVIPSSGFPSAVIAAEAGVQPITRRDPALHCARVQCEILASLMRFDRPAGS